MLVFFFLRYEKQLEQEEQAYQQQRRRLYAEVQEEKERVALQAQKQRQELDEARAALEVSEYSLVSKSRHNQKTPWLWLIWLCKQKYGRA